MRLRTTDNAKAAAGIGRQTTELASEIVAYQNEIVDKAFDWETTGTPQGEVDVKDYPRVERLNRQATEEARQRRDAGLRVGLSRSVVLELGR